MNSLSTVFSSIALIALGFVTYRVLVVKRPPAPLPPGPKGLPLLGNIADLPQTQPWETFSKWGDMYGGITHVSALGQHIIILNDAKYAADLFDKKSLLYSDRPTLVMGGQLVGWDEGPALSSFGERWSVYRRLMSQFMGTKTKVDAFAHVVQTETQVLLRNILVNPREWVEHARRFAGGIVLELAYGHRTSDPGGHELVQLVDNAMDGFSEATKPNAFLVDVLPILRFVPAWFPGAGWKRKVSIYHDCLEQMLRAPFELVKRQIAAGTARSSFTQSHLDGKKHTPKMERIIQWTAAGIYSGGADTTVAGIECFILAMTRHRIEQQKAQAEIDAVIGFDRLPTAADRERLPYCEALYLEVMRMYTFGPLGLPHVAREDDLHEGYLIPKGSIIIPNNWRFFRDPRAYPNSGTFSPERFIGADKQLDPKKYLFGYGRRICPGIHLADASLWLACVSTLAAFDILPPAKDGSMVVPPASFLDGSISHPAPFECGIQSRSASAKALINELSAAH